MSKSTKIVLMGFGNYGDYKSVLTTCKCCLHMLVFQPVTTGRVHGRKYADLGPVPFTLFCLPHELAHCVFPEWSQLISVALFPLIGHV